MGFGVLGAGLESGDKLRVEELVAKVIERKKMDGEMSMCSSGSLRFSI